MKKIPKVDKDMLKKKKERPNGKQSTNNSGSKQNSDKNSQQSGKQRQSSQKQREQSQSKVTQLASKSKPLYPEIVVDKGHIYKHTSDSKIKIGREIKLEEIQRSIDTDGFSYKLSFYYGGEKKEINLPRKELGNRNKLLEKLTGSGGDVYQHNATDVIKHLRNEEERYRNQDIVNVHHYLGWDEIDDELVFKHSQAAGIQSKYIGDLEIEPTGDYQKWNELIKEEVLGNTALETALVLGLSSAIVGMIGSDIDMNNLLVHIYGDSTEGKTTAAMLAASCWGNPSSTGSGLVKNWNATQNALLGLLKNNHGFPVIFDESSMCSSYDLSNIIYILASGKDKDRMNKNAELKETDTWGTTIISTGEHALTTKTKQNAGILVRIEEIGFVTWTEDAENAERIKQTIIQHYGHIGKQFANQLKRAKKKSVLTIYSNQKQQCQQALSVTKFDKRIAGKLALLMTTAKLADNFLNLGLDLEAIRKFLIQAKEEQMLDQEDIGKRAYQHFLEQITANKSKFVRDFGPDLGKVDKKQTDDTWGQINYNKQESAEEITILPDIFKELMIEGGFEEPKLILQEWRDEGLLDHESDRLSRRRKINDFRQKVYVVKVKDEYEEELKEQDTD